MWNTFGSVLPYYEHWKRCETCPQMRSVMHLTPAQQAAITYVEKYALGRREQAREAIEEVRAMCNATPAQVAHALWAIRIYGRAVLHFHPDRLDNQGAA